MPLARALLLAALVVFLAAPARAEKPAEPPIAPFAAAVADFGDAVHSALRKEPGNLFFSPTSLHAALSMLREGAAGATASQMDEALRLPKGGAGDGWRRLTGRLAPRTGRGPDGEILSYALRVANAIWVQTGFLLEPTFPDRLRDLYASVLTRLDFREAEAARAAINAWCARETNDKIPEILPAGEPVPTTRLILTNAVYFKASWGEPFAERATKDEPFRRQDGSEVTVRMMHSQGRFSYRETADAQVLELPYLMGDVSMVVLLPKAKDGLPAIEENLRTRDAIGPEPAGSPLVRVGLPRFRFSWGDEMTPVLQALGMADAFDPAKADFTRISTAEPLYVGFVRHKAFVAVDEAGTEAAAVTAVGVRAGAAPRPEEPVVFQADHPFLFWIVHRPTGTILFQGRVADPTQS